MASASTVETRLPGAISREFRSPAVQRGAGSWSERPRPGDRGDRLVGDAALNYDTDAGGLDIAFSSIRNIDLGAAHSTAVIFADVPIGPDGTFSLGAAGDRIEGGFHGPGHAEAAGIFERSGIIGAFGAKKR